MLVLSRKEEESIIIGDKIEIKVLSIKGDTVKIGISAPPSTKIYRKEIFQEIQRANIESLKSSKNLKELIIKATQQKKTSTEKKGEK